MKRVILSSTKSLPVKYEVECQRRNITPREFYWTCKQRLAAKGVDIGSWTEYDEWCNPTAPQEFNKYNHGDWDEPQRECTKYMPYDMQLYLENTYNFIMEFEFDTEKTGHGYMYVIEYK